MLVLWIRKFGARANFRYSNFDELDTCSNPKDTSSILEILEDLGDRSHSKF